MSQRPKLVAYSSLMCAMIIVSTLWIRFPIPGTSMLFTTQVFFVLLCGHLFPPLYCVYSIGAYLLLGLIGIPVFSSTQGLAVMATPSFGYLLSFPFAAVVVSKVRRGLRLRKGGGYCASVLGIVTIYAIALPYIALLNTFYLGSPISISVLLNAYCLTFLPMDIVKGFLAALLAPRLAKAIIL